MRRFLLDQSENMPRAILAIVASVLALSLGDAVIKLTSAAFSVWQLFTVRSLIVLPVLIGLILVCYGGRLPRLTAVGWTVLRSLLLTGMWIAYYIALPAVDLAIAAAALYTTPLFITLIASATLGERVGARGWLGVVVGFAGVLTVLRPDADAFTPFALLPLLSAFFYALAMVLTRSKCRDESPLMLAAALNACFLAVGVLASLLLLILGDDTVLQNPLTAGWNAMEAAQWGVAAILALAILVGSIGAAVAYQSGPASVVSIFDYSYLGFAVLWGVIFFAEAPDMIAALGIGMIAIAGILVAVRR